MILLRSESNVNGISALTKGSIFAAWYAKISRRDGNFAGDFQKLLAIRARVGGERMEK